MFKNSTKLNIWGRYIIIVVITIIISFIINKMLFIPIISAADNNAWLQYWGALIGALIAGLVTLWGIEYTIKSTLMNVKPLIRPISSEYYIYQKKEIGLAMSEKDIASLIEEYYMDVEMETDPMEMLIIDAAYGQVLEEYKDSKWQKDIERIDFGYFKNKIIELCKYETGEKAFLILDRNIKILDNTGCNEDIVRKIIYNMKQFYIQKIAHRVFHRKQMKWFKMLPVYNVGVGNAIDIVFNWSFKDGSYKILLDKIGFNDVDYSKLNKSFSLEDIEPLKTDILLNSNGENKVYIPLASELVLLIKHIAVKYNNREFSTPGMSELSSEYNKVANLSIECVDIHGEKNIDNYNVLLKMFNGIEDKYEYTETYVNIRFETC